jgi:acetyl-CoA C-acetyltransferase
MSGVSAMQAIKLAALSMKAGEIDCAIAGGASSVSRQSPMPDLECNSLDNQGPKRQDLSLRPYLDYSSTISDCETLAAEHGIGRLELDEWVYRSHYHYGQARESGRLRSEIIPLGKQPQTLEIDEAYRPDITLAELTQLSPFPGSLTVTRGHLAHPADGAAALLLMTRQKALEMGLMPLATLISSVSLAIQAERTPEAPGYATLMVLKKAGLSIDDLQVLEIGEDYACTPLVSLKIAAGGEARKIRDLKAKTNVNGGTLATGNPETAIGARIVMSLTYELQRAGGGYALGVVAGVLGQAGACIIKAE